MFKRNYFSCIMRLLLSQMACSNKSIMKETLLYVKFYYHSYAVYITNKLSE